MMMLLTPATSNLEGGREGGHPNGPFPSPGVGKRSGRGRGEEKQVRQVGHITSTARLRHFAVNLGDFKIWIFKENLDILFHSN